MAPRIHLWAEPDRLRLAGYERGEVGANCSRVPRLRLGIDDIKELRDFCEVNSWYDRLGDIIREKS